MVRRLRPGLGRLGAGHFRRTDSEARVWGGHCWRAVRVLEVLPRPARSELVVTVVSVGGRRHTVRFWVSKQGASALHLAGVQVSHRFGGAVEDDRFGASSPDWAPEAR